MSYHNSEYMGHKFHLMRNLAPKEEKGMCIVCEDETLRLQTFSEPGYSHKVICPTCGNVDLENELVIE